MPFTIPCVLACCTFFECFVLKTFSKLKFPKYLESWHDNKNYRSTETFSEVFSVFIFSEVV